MSIWDRARRRAEDIDQENKTRRMWHSRGYHKFFEGYTEYYAVQENGRRKLERVYTSSYYQQNLAGWKRPAVRILYAGLYLAALALFLFSAVRQEDVWYLTLPVAAVVPFLVLLLIAFFHYVFAPVNMEIYRYKQSSVNLKRYALLCCICLFLCAAIMTFFAVRNPSFRTCSSAVSSCLGGICMLAVSLVETRIPYSQIQNDTQAPYGGIELG